MKKAFAAFLALLILCSAACADIPDEFIENWNKAAHIYGAPELSRDDMIRQPDVFGWIVGSEWVLGITDATGEITEAHVAAVSGDDLLRLSVMLGVTVVQDKTADSLQQYLGNVLTMYLRITSGKSSRHAVFGDFEYDMVKEEDGFWFNMVMN